MTTRRFLDESNNGADGRSQGPWWIMAIYKLGVPVAIAGFLVWWVTTVVASSLTTIQTELWQHVTSTNLYLRAICLHGSHTQEERDECPPLATGNPH